MPGHQQRGAAGLTAIVTLLLAVVFAALAIDAGRLGWEARRLQKVADMSAIGAVTRAGLCSGVTTLSQSALESAAQASATDNGYAGDLAAEGGVAVGNVTTVGGLRTFTGGGAIEDANAVEITATQTVQNSLVAGGLFGGTTSIQRRAVAYDEVVGAFAAGSFLLNVNSGDSPVLDAVLGGLLGGAVNLSVASYQGLADAQVTLQALADAAGPGGVGLTAGSVEDFLSASVTATEFMQILATAMNGSTVSADVNGLATATTNVNTIAIGDLLNVTTENPQSAGAAELNVFGLITGSAQIASEGNTLTLPLTVSLPLGLGAVVVEMVVVEGPQYAMGSPGMDSGGNWKTQVRTSQVRLQAGVLISGLAAIAGLADVTGNLSVYAEIAPSTAWLQSITCANATTLAHQVSIGALTGSASLGVGQFNDISDPSAGVSPAALSVQIAKLLGGLASIDVTVTAPVDVVNASSSDVDFTVNSANPLPQTNAATTALASALGDSISNLSSSLDVSADVGLLGGLLILSAGGIQLAVADDLVTPLLNALDDVLLNPLFEALGIHLGGADITLLDIRRGDPRLVR